MQVSCEQALEIQEFPVFRYKELLKKMDETSNLPYILWYKVFKKQNIFS